MTASAWVETDKNMPNTKSLLRHIKYTRDYLKEHWDVDPVMHCGDKLRWVEDEYSKTEDKIIHKSHCDTPYGAMRRHLEERPHSGVFQVVNAIADSDDFDKLEYVIDTALEGGDFTVFLAQDDEPRFLRLTDKILELPILRK